MGNSASCFDPVREHPPYSWPKDHPGRDEAIAERKRSRRSKRRSAAQPIDTESAKDIISTTTEDIKQNVSSPVTVDTKQNIASLVPPVKNQSPVKSKLVEDLEIKKDNILDKPKSPQVTTKQIPITPVINEKPEIVDHSLNQPIEPENVSDEIEQNHDQLPVETEPLVVVDEEADDLLDDDEKIENVDVVQIEEPEIEKVEEKEQFIDAATNETTAKATTQPITPIKELSEEEIKPVQPIEETPMETKVIDPVEEIKEDIPNTTTITTPTLPTTEKKNLKETDDASSTAFDNTRAMFDNTKDDLPEIGDLKRDVFDPVMKEYITLPEYRQRQTERAQGVVKERVEKFEEIDDQVSKQKAEMQAIDAVRVEMAEKAEWRFKTNSSEKDVVESIEPEIGATTVLDNVTDEDEEDEIDEAVVIEGIPSLTDLDGSANDSMVKTEEKKTTVVEPAILPTS